MKNKNVVLVQSKHKRWILDFIAQDLCLLEKCDLVYVPSRKLHIRKIKGWLYIPRASKIVIFHQDLFIQLYQKGKIRENSNVIVYYTHTTHSDPNLGYLREAKKIIVMSNQAGKYLETNYGISRNKIEVLYGGVDTKQFFAQPRLNEKVAIFVCDYKARKRPDLILRTVKDNKDWHFILHGKNWNKTEEFKKLKLQENFSHYQFSFRNSSELYGRASVYISLSDIEGGPLPAIEALICGKKVILTDTGFAKDLYTLSSDVQVLPTEPTSLNVTTALDRTIYESSSREVKVNYKRIFDYEAFLHKIITLKSDEGEQ